MMDERNDDLANAERSALANALKLGDPTPRGFDTAYVDNQASPRIETLEEQVANIATMLAEANFTAIRMINDPEAVNTTETERDQPQGLRQWVAILGEQASYLASRIHTLNERIGRT